MNGELAQSNQNTGAQNQTQSANTQEYGNGVVHHKKNLYPLVRHTFLIVCVLLAFFFILFLMHQNGKSLYENGL